MGWGEGRGARETESGWSRCSMVGQVMGGFGDRKDLVHNSLVWWESVVINF